MKDKEILIKALEKCLHGIGTYLPADELTEDADISDKVVEEGIEKNIALKIITD